MNPICFEGSHEIGKPDDMTDEQCYSVHAISGMDANGLKFYITCWKPSYEDIQAINKGEPIWVKIASVGLPPMLLFTTINENNECNDLG